MQLKMIIQLPIICKFGKICPPFPPALNILLFTEKTRYGRVVMEKIEQKIIKTPSTNILRLIIANSIHVRLQNICFLAANSYRAGEGRHHG